METNPAARVYLAMLNRISKVEKESVDLRTGGFLRRPIENSSTDANDVAERVAHYFSQVHNERKKFNEDKNA
jgi:hypothetical protein